MIFIAQNYKYPKEALNAKVSGQLLISFVIEKNGLANEFEVINDLGYGTAASGIAVLKKAEKWTPGYQYGMPYVCSLPFQSVYIQVPLQISPDHNRLDCICFNTAFIFS